MRTDNYEIDHYENFPVASVLLPRAMRRPIQIVYRFARSADDFADEGNDTPEQRLTKLDAYRAELQRIVSGGSPSTVLFRDLRTEVIERFGIPVQLFADLLDAFSQDVVQTRYANHDEVLDYARRSANPVGRVVLYIARCGHEDILLQSDAICTALQLINFLQDIPIDWSKGRVYVPQDELSDFGVSETQIDQGNVDANWRKLLAHQADKCRRLLLSGAVLGDSLQGRLGVEIRLTVLGGLTILARIASADYDVFRHRPTLTRSDWGFLLVHALSRTLYRRQITDSHPERS